MKVRSVLAAVVVSTGVLSACGASAPPAKELAIEVIDSLDGVSDDAKACMRAEVDSFEGDELDRLAELADKYQREKTTDTEGAEAIAEFQAALEDCQTAG